MGKLSGRLRIAVLERDGYRCVYCGRTSAEVALQVDHVHPRSKGGSDDSTNLATACFDCNNGKRANTVRLPDHVVLAPVDLPDRAPRYLYPGQRGYAKAEAEAWRQEADRRYPDDTDLAWITGDGRWATVAWCAGLTVALHKTQEAALAALAAIDRFGCGHGCGTSNPEVYWCHEIVDMGTTEELVSWFEKTRGEWRAAHYNKCATCKYLSSGSGNHAAVERMSIRVMRAEKRERMQARATA